DLMRELNARAGLTLVIVTHDPGVGALCDRIIRMSDGLIVGEEVRSSSSSPSSPSLKAFDRDVVTTVDLVAV
ncbi:MAG: hypothetical protein M3R02_17245, partial [Chloroflexota bacterium]|nr:hypothetical protein [Chloroflexota bacterium]